MNKKIIFIDTVCKLTGRHKMSIYRYIKAGTFPKPSKIENRNAWFLSDIENWIDEKMGVA